MGFRAQKLFGTFEKQATVSQSSRNLSGLFRVAIIPIMSLQRLVSQPSYFETLLVFLTIKTC